MGNPIINNCLTFSLSILSTRISEIPLQVINIDFFEKLGIKYSPHVSDNSPKSKIVFDILTR